MYKPKSDYFDFKPVGVGDKVDIYLPNQPRVAFSRRVSVNSCGRLRNLNGHVTEEHITYPYLVLNDFGYVRWLVASCPVHLLNTRLRQMEKNGAPLPYRVVVTKIDGYVFLYWCLNKDIQITPFRNSKEEKRLRAIYVNFCKAFKLTKERYIGLVHNPCYIGNATGKVEDRESALRDFNSSITNRYDKHYYHDAYDYLYKTTAQWACEQYRLNRPTYGARDLYEEMILRFMDTINIEEWPDAVGVSYEDMAANITDYLFDEYEKRIDAYVKARVERGGMKGQVRRDILGPRVRELHKQGRSVREIGAELNIHYTTISRWLKRDDI